MTAAYLCGLIDPDNPAFVRKAYTFGVLTIEFDNGAYTPCDPTDVGKYVKDITTGLTLGILEGYDEGGTRPVWAITTTAPGFSVSDGDSVSVLLGTGAGVAYDDYTAYLLQAYRGEYADQQTGNDYDQGCKGKQLPGVPTTVYFIGVTYTPSLGATYLVKAKYNKATNTFKLVYKQLPGIFGVIDIPKPNQLTVTTGGRVFMPVGSYDSEISGSDLYYLDITGTLSDDPNDWTITARVSYSQISLSKVEGTFCMALKDDETQIGFIHRIKDGDGPYSYKQGAHVCDLDGSNPFTTLINTNTGGYYRVPRNAEYNPSNAKYTCIAMDDAGEWQGTNFDNSGIAQAAINSEERSVAINSNGNPLCIENQNRCNGAANFLDRYPANYSTVTTISMTCPQMTPTHHDVYLPTGDAWTASGAGVEVDGTVRQGTPATQDWEKTKYYQYVCTAAPRAAVSP